MAFQPAPGVALAKCVGTVDGQETINDLYFFASGAISPSSLSLLATNLADWFANTLAPHLSDDWSAQSVQLADISVPDGIMAANGAVNPGGEAGEALPNNVAACVSFRTAQRGRSGRGRNFLPGIPSSVVTLNTMDPTWMSQILDAYTPLVGAGTFAAGWQWSVLSRRTGGALRPTAIAIPITNVLFTSDKVRSMRSREIGHGS